MSLRVLSTAWITPCGRGDLSLPPNHATRTNPFSGAEHPCLEPRETDYADVARLPRLRRSSVISHLAVSVAKEAAEEKNAGEWALVFASADGGILYTRKFFDAISETHAGAGSPILFPETVYNAPASHIAATLGMTGAVLTLSGDDRVGNHTLAAAEQLLNAGAAPVCLIVAAQEVDWITCEALAAFGQTALPATGAAAMAVSLDEGVPLPDRGADVARLGHCRGVSSLWSLIHGLRLTSPSLRP